MGLLPLSTEQQCILKLGEWEQYCTNISTDISRANHLLSWDYTVQECAMRQFNPEDVITSMIKDGGWAIIGDSLAREVNPHSPTFPAPPFLRFPFLISVK